MRMISVFKEYVVLNLGFQRIYTSKSNHLVLSSLNVSRLQLGFNTSESESWSDEIDRVRRFPGGPRRCSRSTERGAGVGASSCGIRNESSSVAILETLVSLPRPSRLRSTHECLRVFTISPTFLTEYYFACQESSQRVQRKEGGAYTIIPDSQGRA